jgi:hypothetical protein
LLVAANSLLAQANRKDAKQFFKQSHRAQKRWPVISWPFVQSPGRRKNPAIRQNADYSADVCSQS